MKTKTLYRVEHRRVKCGQNFAGPYGVSNHVSSVDWMARNHEHTTHPTPNMDPALEIAHLDQREDLICGFSTLAQLRRWFNRAERKKLRELGFLIVSYQAEECFLGKQQSLFRPRGRRRILQDEK